MTVEPFKALIYDDPTSEEEGVIDLSAVIADPENPDAFADRKFNVAQLLTSPELSKRWLDDGWLTSTEPAMFVYKIGRRDINGQPVQWTGVFASNGIADGLSIGPHLEEVQAEGFTELLVPTGMPIARASDESGNHHRIWPIDQYGTLQLIAEAVGERESTGLILAYEANQLPPEFVLGLVMLSGPNSH